MHIYVYIIHILNNKYTQKHLKLIVELLSGVIIL